MGRPLGTRNVMRTAEEKEIIVLEYLNSKDSMSTIGSKHGVYLSVIKNWVREYRESGFKGLESKTGKHTNSNLGKYNRNPSELDKLKSELLKKEIEIERLKKGYLVKGVGAKKEYVTTFDVNTK
jgi:Transposase and inactivated derivatives